MDMEYSNDDLTPSRWAAALVSGRYKQTPQRLCRTGRTTDGWLQQEFCCLGVAGVLAGWIPLLEGPLVTGAMTDTSLVAPDGTTFMSNLGGRLIPMSDDFMAMNDSLHWTFEEIAYFVRCVFEPDKWVCREGLTLEIVHTVFHTMTDVGDTTSCSPVCQMLDNLRGVLATGSVTP